MKTDELCTPGYVDTSRWLVSEDVGEGKVEIVN